MKQDLLTQLRSFLFLLAVILLVKCQATAQILAPIASNPESSITSVPTATPTPVPTGTPVATPSPTPTPTPSPTPEPTPLPCLYRGLAQYYKTYSGWGLPIFTGPNGEEVRMMSCIQRILRGCNSKGIRLAADQYSDIRYNQRVFGQNGDEDDCVVRQVTRGIDNSYSQIAEGSTLGFFMDANCYRVPAPTTSYRLCGVFGVTAIVSPISLLWEPDTDINNYLTFTQFPLELENTGKWYSWKASSQTPLLVYDPKKTREIVSASQLFGNWTFGGQRLAVLNSKPTDTKMNPWKNGYEALGTLDVDNDGKLSGSELADLALWFDHNQNGMSESGEVKSLKESGILTLYYTPDYTDNITGDIHARIGYEREVHGEKVTGASVDWLADRADSQVEAIMMAKARRSLTKTSDLSNHDILSVHSIPDDNGGSAKDKSVVAAYGERKEDFSGGWIWRVSGDISELQRKYIPVGAMTIKEEKAGVISGHIFLETALSPNNLSIQSLVNMATLTGRKELNKDGKLQIKFAVKTSDGLLTESIAWFSADHSKLIGKSVAEVPKPGEPEKILRVSYTWIARRE